MIGVARGHAQYRVDEVNDAAGAVDVAELGQNATFHVADADLDLFLAIDSPVLRGDRQAGVSVGNHLWIVQIVVEQDALANAMRSKQLEQERVVVEAFAIGELVERLISGQKVRVAAVGTQRIAQILVAQANRLSRTRYPEIEIGREAVDVVVGQHLKDALLVVARIGVYDVDDAV